jgi:predicted RNase H-like HicB family nuclease
MINEHPYRVIYYPGEDGWIVGEVPELPGCISQGKTLEELLENIRDAIVGCVAVRRDLGMPERLDVGETQVFVAA